MNQPVKWSPFLKFKYAIQIFALLFLMGCANEPVLFEFSNNHPAHPGAPESDFTPPSNPFHTDVAELAEETQTGTDTMMKQKMPEADGPGHGGHNMGGDKERRSDPERTTKSDHSEDNHQRREEHGQ